MSSENGHSNGGPTIKRFYVVRTEDVSGVSGTGRVAEGVEFTDGTCAIRWLSHTSATGVYANVKQLLIIHGHEDRTTVEYID